MAGGLKLALSQYRDLEAFASFSSDLDPTSRAQLDRGARLVELLKQPQYSPFPVERQVVSVWMGTEGYLDDVPVEDVRRFENEFLDELSRSNAGIYDAIRETGQLTEDTIVALKDAIERFRGTFEKSDGSLLVSDEPAEPLDADEIEAERLRKYPTGQADAAPADSAPAESARTHDGRPIRQRTSRAVLASMGAQLRAVRRRIRSVQSTAKITRAQELIASSRIIKAQQRLHAAAPYAQGADPCGRGSRQQVRADRPPADAPGGRRRPGQR